VEPGNTKALHGAGALDRVVASLLVDWKCWGSQAHPNLRLYAGYSATLAGIGAHDEAVRTLPSYIG